MRGIFWKKKGGVFFLVGLVFLTALVAVGAVYTGYVTFEEHGKEISVSFEELLVGKKIIMRSESVATLESNLWEYKLSLVTGGEVAEFEFVAPHGKQKFYLSEGTSEFIDVDGNGKNELNVSFEKVGVENIEVFLQLIPAVEEEAINASVKEGEEKRENKTIVGTDAEFAKVNSDLSTFESLVRNKVRLLFLLMSVALVLAITAALSWSYYTKKKRTEEDEAFEIRPGR